MLFPAFSRILQSVMWFKEYPGHFTNQIKTHLLEMLLFLLATCLVQKMKLSIKTVVNYCWQWILVYPTSGQTHLIWKSFVSKLAASFLLCIGNVTCEIYRNILDWWHHAISATIYINIIQHPSTSFNILQHQLRHLSH
jgi:hypothetical protein